MTTAYSQCQRAGEDILEVWKHHESHFNWIGILITSVYSFLFPMCGLHLDEKFIFPTLLLPRQWFNPGSPLISNN